MAQVALKPINLLRGWPADKLLAISILRDASIKVFSDLSISAPALQYANDQGSPLLRTTLSSFLAEFYSHKQLIPIDRITITGGASQSMGVALSVVTDPSYTRACWVIEPSYFLAFSIVNDAGLRIESVQDGPRGIDFDAFRNRLQAAEHGAARTGAHHPRYKTMPLKSPAKIYKHIFYCVPSFSNPTGRCMNLKTRIELVRLARAFDALIICDDVYDFLWWPASVGFNECLRGQATLKAVVPRLVDIDTVLDGGAKRSQEDGFGNVLSNGSFSKILGPGIRTGWVEAAPKLAFSLSQAGPIKSGGASSALAATMVAQTLLNGTLQTSITNTLVPSYRQRWQLLMDAIRTYLEPMGAVVPWPVNSVSAINDISCLSQADVDQVRQSFTENRSTDLPNHVAGGFFIWVRLPKGVDATELAIKAAKDFNLTLQTEVNCRVPKQKLDDNPLPSDTLQGGDAHQNQSLRICLTYSIEHDLVEGIKRTAKVLEQYIHERRA